MSIDPFSSATEIATAIRLRRVSALATGRELPWSGRTTVVDTLFNSDPLGEIRIEVPDAVVDECATVIAVLVDPPG